MRFKKRFGQNFLIDEDVVLSLVKAAKISPEDVVLEVGAGTGVVTKELAKYAKKVIAIEIDRDLIPRLRESIKEFNNVEIINSDILSFLENCKKNSTFKVVGSIPYQITSPLIHALIMLDTPPQSITLVVQYEVAEKICAKPPNATYLSNFISLFGEAKIVQKVKKQSFYPQPSMESAIIHIKRKDKIPKQREFKIWSGFLHRGFSHPRKMLKFGARPTARAQELSLDSWISIFNNETV